MDPRITSYNVCYTKLLRAAWAVTRGIRLGGPIPEPPRRRPPSPILTILTATDKTMTPTLYFLRSSEQKIATDMLHYALRLDAAGRSLDDVPEMRVFDRYYGLTHRDLGLYALSDHQLAGGAWILV